MQVGKLSMPIRSRWTNQFSEIESASKFHNRARQILATDSLLRGFAAYQEVPVKDLVPGYPYTHFFDWYVEELNLIVELHGAQHYKVVNFGNNSYEEAQKQFKDIQTRDSRKKAAAIEAGYEYLAISYKEYTKLNAKRFRDLLFGAST